MPRTDWGWLITHDELRSWILFEDEHLLAINKPAHVVCHPSKHGEWSSLVGAVRQHVGRHDGLHMPTRLDRETSGVVVLVKDTDMRRALHRASSAGAIHKTYHAVLAGHLAGPVLVDQPIGLARDGQVGMRRAVVASGERGQQAVTEFVPLAYENGFTLARVTPRTGRTHQIRVHAAWLGHAVAGDKLYPDERLFLEFIRTGNAPGAAADRQALHATNWHCRAAAVDLLFDAPLPVAEWRKLLPSFCAAHQAQ